MICNYSASPVFVSNRDGELAYRTGLRQIPVKAWGRSPPDFPQRAMPCIASRGKLNSHNDSKENSLLFKLNLFLLSYPHILSLPPKGAGSPAKKPVSPGFFAWVCVGTVLLYLSPLFLFRTRGQIQKDRPPKSKRPPAQIRTGGRCFSGRHGDGSFVSVPIVPVQDKGTETKEPSP